MSVHDRKVVVPEGMLIEAHISQPNVKMTRDEMRVCLEAALRWLSENPIVPTEDQANVIWKGICGFGKTEDEKAGLSRPQYICVEWQRRMFLAPDKDVWSTFLDEAVHEAPYGAVRIEIRTPEGTLLASRDIPPKVKVEGNAICYTKDEDEPIRDLLNDCCDVCDSPNCTHRRNLREAFRRGREGK